MDDLNVSQLIINNLIELIGDYKIENKINGVNIARHIIKNISFKYLNSRIFEILTVKILTNYNNNLINLIFNYNNNRHL